MALDSTIVGAVSGIGVEVNALRHLKITPEVDAIANPSNIGGFRNFSENDQGYLTGVAKLASPEVDIDYRLRVATDLLQDEEVFNYTAQNTGKHSLVATTMTAAFTAGQLTLNSGSGVAVNTGITIQTYAYFPNPGTQVLSADTEIAFSAQPQTNTFIEFGLGQAGFSLASPTDGVFFRLTSAGLFGVASNNSTETVIAFPLLGGTGSWAYVVDKKYQFIVYASGIAADFWVNDGTGAVRLGTITLPVGQGRICMSSGLQYFVKQRVVGGAAGGVIQAKVGAYNVRLGGSGAVSSPAMQGNRTLGSYQALSGGSPVGTLARTGVVASGVEATTAAAVPTTTTAALGSGLGGSFIESATLAVNTDAIIASFQVPLATANMQGRRLVMKCVYLSSYVQAAIVGGPYAAEWFLAFGHTSLSLATNETVSTKAPRRIILPTTQFVSAAQAAITTVAQSVTFCDFGDAPIYVNPGEFIQLCTRHVGTAATSGTIAHRVTYVYGWE